MDEGEQDYYIHDMPLDILMDEHKLREFANMFEAHTVSIENEINDMKRAVEKKESQLEFVKEKHKTLKQYIQFLDYGGHAFAKEMIKENHHVFENASEKVFGYKICGKEVKSKKQGWVICIRHHEHKGRCSSTKIDTDKSSHYSKGD